MGLLRRGHDDGPPARRFVMREKMLAIGDDFWIEDADGQKVFKVNGKAMRLRDTFVLEDAQGNELAKIQERKLSVRGAAAHRVLVEPLGEVETFEDELHRARDARRRLTDFEVAERAAQARHVGEQPRVLR